MNFDNIHMQFSDDWKVTWFWYTRLRKALEMSMSLTWEEIPVESFLSDDSIKYSLIQALCQHDEWEKVLDYEIMFLYDESIDFETFALKLLDLQSEKIKFIVDNINIFSEWFIVYWSSFANIRIFKTWSTINMISVNSLLKIFEIINIKYEWNYLWRLSLYISLLNGYNTWIRRLSIQNRNRYWTDNIEEEKNSQIFYNCIVDNLILTTQEILKNGEIDFFESIKIIISENKIYYSRIVENFSKLANFLRTNFTFQELNSHIRKSIESFIEIFLWKYMCYLLQLWVWYDIILKSVIDFSLMHEMSYFSLYIRKFIVSDMFTNELCDFFLKCFKEWNYKLINDIIFNYLKKWLTTNDLWILYEKMILNDRLKNEFILNIDKFWVYESMYILFRFCLYDYDLVSRVNSFEKLSTMITWLINNNSILDAENINIFINLFDIMIISFEKDWSYMRSRFIRTKLSLLCKYKNSFNC